MKDKKNKKGGKRVGAGRKPSGRQKQPVTVYTDVSKFGGRDGTRVAIYAFLDGNFELLKQNGFWPSAQFSIASEESRKGVDLKFPPPKAMKEPRGASTSNLNISLSFEKEPDNEAYDASPLPKPVNDDPLRRMEIQRQIESIRAEKIPKERDTVFGRKSWQLDRQKRIQELQNKLK